MDNIIPALIIALGLVAAAFVMRPPSPSQYCADIVRSANPSSGTVSFEECLYHRQMAGVPQ